MILFNTEIVVLDRMSFHAVFIPGDVAEQLDLKPNTRLIGTCNDVPFRRAAVSNGSGQYYLILGKDLRKKARCAVGFTVAISLEIDPHPDFLDIPEEFLAALDQDDEARQLFDDFTIGYQRSIIHYVGSAKRIETRIKRSLELCEKIRTRTLHGMKDK